MEFADLTNTTELHFHRSTSFHENGFVMGSDESRYLVDTIWQCFRKDWVCRRHRKLALCANATGVAVQRWRRIANRRTCWCQRTTSLEMLKLTVCHSWRPGRLTQSSSVQWMSHNQTLDKLYLLTIAMTTGNCNSRGRGSHLHFLRLLLLVLAA